MSGQAQNDLLAGIDPVVVLEAASTVLADIESERLEPLLARLPLSEQRSVAAWMTRTKREGVKLAPTPLPPLAALAATTLALALSTPGKRSDDLREDVADRLVRVGMRFNDVVLGVQMGTDSVDRTLEYMARSTLWRAIETEEWMIWAGELAFDLEEHELAQPALTRFRELTGLSAAEWWSRSFGERATRAVHGARSWAGTNGVDGRVERAWTGLTLTPLGDAVESARSAVRDGRRGTKALDNPFDLGWLATRPVVEAPDGRRFQLWLGANTRALLPSVFAQVVADNSESRFDDVTSALGRVAEARLSSAVERLPTPPAETWIAEADMPDSGSKCDYLLCADSVLVGLEFTLITPSRDLSAGTSRAVNALIQRLREKFMQVYSTFEREDPTHAKRWIPVVVLASPSVADPLLNSRVHQELKQGGHLPDTADDDLITCNATDFLDLLELAELRSESPIQTILRWRESANRGAFLDWWLADQGAHRLSAQRRSGPLTERVEALLSTPDST